MSISDIAISAIEDKIKLMILREKWKELFSELAEISTVIDFNEKIIYIKSYDSVLKHYIFANKQKLINEIMESLEIKFEIEDIKINGEKSPRLKTITNLCLKGCDIQTLLIALDLRGICVSGGSACMSGAHEDSHVLKEMGLNSEELKSSFRVSIGKDTTIEEIDYFIDNLKEIAKIERGI